MVQSPLNNWIHHLGTKSSTYQTLGEGWISYIQTIVVIIAQLSVSNFNCKKNPLEIAGINPPPGLTLCGVSLQSSEKPGRPFSDFSKSVIVSFSPKSE